LPGKNTKHFPVIIDLVKSSPRNAYPFCKRSFREFRDQKTWFLAVLGGMARLGSFKSQAPSTKEVPSPKSQRAALDGHHIARTLVWSFFGAWSLVLWCALYSIENSEELKT
jgi:hypothetical protein